MGYISINVNEDLLRNILGMPREGIRLVVKRTCIMEFFKEYSKISTTHCAGLFQKFMKGEYQLVFQLVNKVLVPPSEAYCDMLESLEK